MPALSVVEVGSIARGIVVADAIVKRAAVRLLRSDPVTPGKLVIVMAGPVAEVEESLDAAQEAAGVEELDVLLLPHAHPAIVPALEGIEREPLEGAVGVLELATVAATLRAADAALKEAETELAALHLARGIGGKGYVVLSGEQHAVEASLDAGDGAVEAQHRVGRELIARPHPDLDWVLGRVQGRG